MGNTRPVAKARANVETPLKWTVILFQPALAGFGY
jgi:hypothetical protein